MDNEVKQWRTALNTYLAPSQVPLIKFLFFLSAFPHDKNVSAKIDTLTPQSHSFIEKFTKNLLLAKYTPDCECIKKDNIHTLKEVSIEESKHENNYKTMEYTKNIDMGTKNLQIQRRRERKKKGKGRINRRIH